MTVSRRERQTTRNVIIAIVVTMVLLTHYIKHLSETSGGQSPYAENYAKSNQTIASVNEFRLMIGSKVRKLADYCPNKGREYCEAGVDGFRTALGLD